MRIEIHGTVRDPEAAAVITVRVDGKLVAQLQHAGVNAADAMTSALAGAIVAIAREEVRNAQEVLRAGR